MSDMCSVDGLIFWSSGYYYRGFSEVYAIVGQAETTCVGEAE
jgi:hypothetical protein